MTKFRLNKELYLLIIAVVVGILLGYRLNGADTTPGIGDPMLPALDSPTDGTLGAIYVCPMMCVPARKAGGKCPICGMDLIAVYGEGLESEGPPSIRLAPEAVKLAEIETVPVEKKFVSAEVRLFGQIDYDPAHVTKITAFMPGVIDRVYVKRAGQFVRWGEPLFDLYSSDLLETQKQLVGAMKYVPSFFAFQAGIPHAAREVPVQERVRPEDKLSPEAEAAMKTIAGIRNKLTILGLPKRDIDELMKRGEATGIATIYSSVYGQVIDQQAFEGAYINTGTPIFTIGDPRYVWVRLDGYEADYSWMRKGQTVTFETDAYPGERFSGQVVYIDPVFNTATRTFTLGAVSGDPGGRLKAGMLVRAAIHARLTAAGTVVNEDENESSAPLVIPVTAPLITGKRAVVYVKSPDGDGRFEGREVVLGPRGKNYYIVLAGLDEGEQVVKSGSFKIDSAVQIMAKASMMSMEGGESAIGHQSHGGSDGLHRDYWNKRMKSREAAASDHEAALEPGEPKSDNRGDSVGRRTISRRKPGAYGDVTRRQRRFQ